MQSIGVAAVGVSAWGQNVVRALRQTRGADLRWMCDLNEQLLASMATRFPGVTTTGQFERVLSDPAVQAVAIAVDAPNHHRLARQALESGRHVLVEKPLTLSSRDAEELCLLAERAGLILMTGHLLLYHPAVERAKALVDAGELGEVLYLHTQRVNLGVVRQSENAWWSLAPHDIAVAMHLFGATPRTVSATGASYLQREREVHDVVFATLHFPDDRLAHLHVSWLDPDKRRSLTVVGSRKMLTFDDARGGDKLRIYDCGVEHRPGYSSRAEGLLVRMGEVSSLPLPQVEPLVAECEHFISCVSTGAVPRSDGQQGRAVVQVLEAGQRSIRAGGVPISLQSGSGAS